MQWDEKQFSELTGQPHPDITRYLDTRHLPAPKSIAPAHLPVQAQNKGLDATTALIVRVGPPVVALTALASIMALIGAVVSAVIGAACLFISEHAMVIGGGALALCAAVGALAGLGGSSSKSSDANQPPPNDGGKYEWYQEQRQGWRKV